MKKKDLIITLIFIFMLVGPNIIYWFLYDKMDHTNYENKGQTIKPTLTYKNITNYPKEYENYYNDSIAFKNEFRKYSSYIHYKLLDTTTSKKVIVGKDNWLFYSASNDGNTIYDFQKITRYSDKEKEFIKDKLESTKEQLEEENIDFYLFIAPNKENIYSDYLPSIINRNDKTKYSKTEDLINYLNKESNINIVYPKDALISNKKISSTYYKYDTHWNDYGAYLGTIELIKKIDSNYEEPNIKLKYSKHGGDLANMILLNNTLSSNEPSIKKFYVDNSYICENINNTKQCKTDDYIYDKTLFIIGDSFREGMTQYLSKIFKETIIMHRDFYNPKLIEEYNPDIFVYETVERYSSFLINYKITE